ncbi:MAG TPA: GNAT family N-acetyltransferase [archaeon]|nr:GNAT family N-acetyltransferase [archaeon]
MLEKITPEYLKAEKMGAIHTNILTNFSTDNKELKAFLVEDSMKNQQLSISTTYLWFHKKTGELVAYVSLLNDSLRIRETELENIFVEKGILYKSLPALKIGRLCVDKRFAGRGIGTFLTKFAMIKASKIGEEVGCRFLVLDSKKEAVEFYKKIGFWVLREEEKETVTMYYDLLNIVPLYKEPKR